MRGKGGEYIPHKLVDSSKGRKRRGLHQDRGITQLPPGVDDEDAPNRDPDLEEGMQWDEITLSCGLNNAER